MSVEEAAQVNPEDDEKARKEWRRQATAVINNAKFNRALSKFLGPAKVTQSPLKKSALVLAKRFTSKSWPKFLK